MLLTTYKNLFSLLLVSLLLVACSGGKPQIKVVCEENVVGNSIVKWEITPPVKGEVKVYTSATPDSDINTDEDTPVASANISAQYLTVVTPDPNRRYYYTIVFADKYKVKVATRNINMPGVQNFRDVGGYKTDGGKKEVRWGRLYRSGKLENLSACTVQELKNIGIKTILDLRGANEADSSNSLNRDFNVVSFPIAIYDIESMIQEVSEPSFDTTNIGKVVERMNRNLVNNYTKEYAEMFKILLDEKNYPAVIVCTSGKGRTGVVTAMILHTLGVNEDDVMADYRLSNRFFNIAKDAKEAYKLPVSTQEAITAIFSAREDYLNAARSEIERQYGSVDNYIHQAIGLTEQDVDKLKSILLTNCAE